MGDGMVIEVSHVDRIDIPHPGYLYRIKPIVVDTETPRNATVIASDTQRQRRMISPKVASKSGGHGSRTMMDTEVHSNPHDKHYLSGCHRFLQEQIQAIHVAQCSE